MTLPTILHANHDWHYYWRFLGEFHLLVPVALGGGGVAVHKYLQKARESRAAMWPSASAEVQSATLKKRHGYWAVDVSYRYYAQQEYRYGKYRKDFRRRPAAETFAAAIRGKQVQVRYQPDQPETSVLMEHDLRLSGALETS